MIKNFDIFKRNNKKEYVIFSVIEGVKGIEKYIFTTDDIIYKNSIKFINYNAQQLESLINSDILLFTEKEATKIVNNYNKIFKVYEFYSQKYEEFLIELDANKYNL